MADKHTVDARGLSCPQPVLMTKKALQANPSANAFEIIVDNGHRQGKRHPLWRPIPVSP